MITLERGVNVFDEYTFGPTAMRVTIREDLLERILLLNKHVKILGVLKIVEFDDTPKYYEDNICEKLVKTEEKLECKTLNVTEYSIYWSGLIKHTNVHWESDSILINELLEIKKVKEASMKELPLMINHLEYSDAKDLMKQRIREGK